MFLDVMENDRKFDSDRSVPKERKDASDRSILDIFLLVFPKLLRSSLNHTSYPKALFRI